MKMELNWRLFLLHHSYPGEFVTSQWQENPTRVSPLYLTFRLLFLGLVLIGYILHIATMQSAERRFYPIELGHWGMTTILAFELLDFVLIANELRMQKSKFGRR